MKRFLKLFSLILLVGFSARAEALGTTWRPIYELSCSATTSVCGVRFQGVQVGPDACKSNLIRWFTDDAGGAETLLLLATAFYSNKYVSIEVDEECFAPQPNLPALRSVRVAK